MSEPKDDAKGQYAPSQADRNASSVHSAKPTVITGSGMRPCIEIRLNPSRKRTSI